MQYVLELIFYEIESKSAHDKFFKILWLPFFFWISILSSKQIFEIIGKSKEPLAENDLSK